MCIWNIIDVLLMHFDNPWIQVFYNPWISSKHYLFAKLNVWFCGKFCPKYVKSQQQSNTHPRFLSEEETNVSST